MKVPRSSFYPKPRVDSALVTIRPISSTVPVKDQKILEDLVRDLFTQRRRKLRGVLARYLTGKYDTQTEEMLSKTNLTEKRVYELTPAEFINLSNLIADAAKQS
jgi:16S rRNA (adenine1518-N6/adenine1519-N6)-dimethyltransferase